MKNTILKIGAAFVVAIAVFVIALPTIMHKAGLHPQYTGETQRQRRTHQRRL